VSAAENLPLPAAGFEVSDPAHQVSPHRHVGADTGDDALRNNPIVSLFGDRSRTAAVVIDTDTATAATGMGHPRTLTTPSTAEMPAAGSAHCSIAIGRALGTVVVTVHGELDTAGTAYLGRILADLIDFQGNLSVVVDLHDTIATDADTVGVFVDAAEQARRRGAALTLHKPPAALYEALRLRGLDVLVSTEHRAATHGDQPAECSDEVAS
jgi:anti-anti-sigma factor